LRGRALAQRAVLFVHLLLEVREQHVHVGAAQPGVHERQNGEANAYLFFKQKKLKPQGQIIKDQLSFPQKDKHQHLEEEDDPTG
jgi:hypothetical protein